jgi:hypothetical protein
MNDTDTLYKDLQTDLDRISGPLFEFGEQQVRSSGAEFESSIEVLPLLHEGLRATVKQGGISAVTICEWVKITREGGKQTDAMKVLVEHERGLTVAFYVPCHKSTFSGWTFEGMFAQ